MGIFGDLFDPVSPMPWEMGDVPGRKQSLRLEDIYDITPSAESKYPESVWAPPPEIGRGPASDPYPDPYEFKKRELVAACRQAMKMNGMGEKYPRPWTIDDEPTNYMAFPILPGQRIWTGGEPGRFRIVYNKFDGSFYRVVMHRYTTPLSERESTSLGFCWVGEKCGHESSHCHFGSTSPFAKSSHEYPFSPDDIGPHPLRQNPLEVESPRVATKQINNVKSPTHESDPCFVHATIEPVDTPSNAESRRPSLGNRLVKSPPSTPRRFSNVLSPPQSQRTMLVKSPPVRSRSNAIQSLSLGSDPGPIILSPSSRSISDNIQSPPPSTYAHLPKSTPTVSRHLSIIPSPEIDQENRFVKSPPLPPRRTSVIQSPHDGYDPRLPRSPRLAANSFSSIHSPVINQDSPFIKSPPMTPMTPQSYSNMHSPTMGYDPGLQRSPRISIRPFNTGQSPILEEETPIKSLKVGIRPSRSFQSPVLGQDPRLTNSPPVIQITRWTDHAQPRRASHA